MNVKIESKKQAMEILSGQPAQYEIIITALVALDKADLFFTLKVVKC